VDVGYILDISEAEEEYRCMYEVRVQGRGEEVDNRPVKDIDISIHDVAI
jgi:hypothetical protein